jgi:hypothetical protein
MTERIESVKWKPQHSLRLHSWGAAPSRAPAPIDTIRHRNHAYDLFELSSAHFLRLRPTAGGSMGDRAMLSRIARAGAIARIPATNMAWIREGFRAMLLILVLASAGVGTAFARTIYDGDWSVVIVTNTGACSSSYRYGLQIADGTVVYDGGGMVTMQGRVTPKGAVRVSLRAGGQWADGSGRLTKFRGGGVWRGQGMGGTCAGTWVAERRG